MSSSSRPRGTQILYTRRCSCFRQLAALSLAVTWHALNARAARHEPIHIIYEYDMDHMRTAAKGLFDARIIRCGKRRGTLGRRCRTGLAKQLAAPTAPLLVMLTACAVPAGGMVLAGSTVLADGSLKWRYGDWKVPLLVDWPAPLTSHTSILCSLQVASRSMRSVALFVTVRPASARHGTNTS